MKAQRLIYTGRVQGVGFRYTVKHLSMGYDLTGYVRNMPDGTVELLAQGEEEEIEALKKEVQNSHLQSFIRKMDVENVSVKEELKGFEIRL
jgi:acylphosphatase